MSARRIDRQKRHRRQLQWQRVTVNLLFESALLAWHRLQRAFTIATRNAHQRAIHRWYRVGWSRIDWIAWTKCGMCSVCEFCVERIARASATALGAHTRNTHRPHSPFVDHSTEGLCKQFEMNWLSQDRRHPRFNGACFRLRITKSRATHNAQMRPKAL